jgi:hypothetical protein
MRVVGKERAAEIQLFSKACCECSRCKRNEERDETTSEKQRIRSLLTINVPVVNMGRYEVVLRGDYP